MKKYFKMSNVIISICLILLVLFTLRIHRIVENGGYEPSTLITAVFGAVLGEFGILGYIKGTKIKNGQENNSDGDELPPGVG